ncbi:Kynureninase (L-kynurenine hydrolase) [Neophaeococcomyces mojaviensis]|uniref:Kynureninase (L-kynurenine hydrolase) n=1 Tax=Neophaeococcomyces mojaviensis TaxID=3383035 RepID=A0ACC3A9B2_9EURO|nr:Kynureninase (L-kynurenine hydrolase) [Knufia sp. JES_112]
MSPSRIDTVNESAAFEFPDNANTLEYAQSQDTKDSLRHLRSEYIIPSKANLKSKKLAKPGLSDDEGIYFCGNSLGLQPKAMSRYIEAQLDTWSSIGVQGHFTDVEDSPLSPWQDMAKSAAKSMARLVGALPEEVAAMNTLTINLHLLMASFYRPSGRRTKILLEWKAFPSDHYAIESQIRWHGLDPEENMILLEPDEDHEISTKRILRAIDDNADEIALVMLPGIQYYTGQFFDIETITSYAQSKGLTIGWDLAHAAGNVPVRLHDWNVDFAVWCTYKYMNAGPGSIAGAFVHERHGKVDLDGNSVPKFRPRLSGWYGGDQESRFKMDNKFRPIPGAGGFQCSNPSAIDLSALCASMSVFDKTSIDALRQKSLRLTCYLEHLLDQVQEDSSGKPSFRIITPRDAKRRGTQLSVLLQSGLLPQVAAALQDAGIICDKREPGVIRVAPVPMYNTYEDVWRFVEVFAAALR